MCRAPTARGAAPASRPAAIPISCWDRTPDSHAGRPVASNARRPIACECSRFELNGAAPFLGWTKIPTLALSFCVRQANTSSGVIVCANAWLGARAKVLISAPIHGTLVSGIETLREYNIARPVCPSRTKLASFSRSSSSLPVA
jgi:hypothetical protein